MTPIGPALRRFNYDFQLVTSQPLALWLATELPDASGGIMPDPFVELVAEVELEGNAHVGAVACGGGHGYERPAHPGETEPSAWLLMSACPVCGAAL